MQITINFQNNHKITAAKIKGQRTRYIKWKRRNVAFKTDVGLNFQQTRVAFNSIYCYRTRKQAGKLFLLKKRELENCLLQTSNVCV